MSDPAAPSDLGDLPEPVRARVVALSAEVLPDVAALPPSLRRVAAFTPSRRARLGATALTAALADQRLRERVAVQVAARRSSALADLAGLDDPVDAAALAWLVRPEGWQEPVAAAVDLTAARAAQQEAEQESRWRRRAEAAEQALREQRALHRQQVEDYKAEVAGLRRRLAEARRGDQAVDDAVLDGLRGELDEQTRARRAAEDALAAERSGVRRLQAQVERLEATGRTERRAARSERDEVSLRARLLLDSVIDAAAGLRRELALPPVSGSPADRVEAEVAAERGPRAPGGVADTVSPAVLEQLLALPHGRLLVDGYNVSKGVWGGSSLEAQRIRLLAALAPLVARTGAETTVVFDAADSEHRPPVSPPRGVKVLFSPPGVIADDVLRDLVAAEPAGRTVLVVTDDRSLRADVTRSGARVVGVHALAGLLGRV